MLSLLVAVVLLAHGVGHALFLLPALGTVDWAGQTGQSWLLSPLLGDDPVRLLGAVAWTASIVLFVAAVYGFVGSRPWWRTVAAIAAGVSATAIVIWWDGIATSSAMFALAFDGLVLVWLAWTRRSRAKLARA